LFCHCADYKTAELIWKLSQTNFEFIYW
jgi:hypothetical protein